MRSYVVILVGALTTACVGGIVEDAKYGHAIGEAKVEYQRVRFARSTYPGPLELRNPVVSKTAAGPFPITGAYSIHGRVRVRAGWNRVTVSKSGYDTAIFYRQITYGKRCTQVELLDNAVDLLPETAEETLRCSVENFRLSRSGTHRQKLPDLWTDARFVVHGADKGPCPNDATRRCLFVSVQTGNVGDGALNLQNTPNGLHQIIATTSETSDRRKVAGVLSARGEYGPLIQVRLRRPRRGCRSPANAHRCEVIRESQPHPRRLCDRAVLDSALAKGADFDCDVPGEAGISPGMAWRDDSAVEVVDITDLPSRRYFIEVEVNGDRNIVESDYTNNITRRRILL